MMQFITKNDELRKEKSVICAKDKRETDQEE